MSDIAGNYPAWLEDESQTHIPIRGACTLGRSSSNKVPLTNDGKISRRHAVIHMQGDREFWLVDFGSRNGTFLNDRRIVKPTRLLPGAHIRIGSKEFVFQVNDQSANAEQTSVHADATVAEIAQRDCWLLVADIINSTGLVQKLPPNEFPQVTGRWVAECKEIIEDQGGHINAFTGDGFFAYWRDSAGMENNIAMALQSLRRLQENSPLEFRLAAHLGLVTMGGMSVGEEERISGSEVHTVFRMETLAKKLKVRCLLSHNTSQRLNTILPVKGIGSHLLDGFDGAIPFFAF